MISDEQLQDWKSRCGDYDFCEHEAYKIVPELIAEVRSLRELLDRERKYADDNCMIGVFHGTSMANDKIRQLEREADWLAENAGECPYMSGGSTFCWRHCPMWVGPRDRSGHCEKPDMREAARRAVSERVG